MARLHVKEGLFEEWECEDPEELLDALTPHLAEKLWEYED
jgi:hypothetical protein